jgi:hypothetical protein
MANADPNLVGVKTLFGSGVARREILAATAMGLICESARAEPAASHSHPILELRQYKIVHSRREELIALFDREFVESQEACGMRLIGQFRDLDDPDRFTWLREFPDMAKREQALSAFYGGPVWQAHRGEANPLLEDNDNVLLLRPAWDGAGFGDLPTRRPGLGEAAVEAASVVVATIHYLWKKPDEGFSEAFRREFAPALSRAGLPVLGAYVVEEAPNNFPRLPIRQGEKLFVWFTRVRGEADHISARQRLSDDEIWRSRLAARLDDFEERSAQVLRLAPTNRSRLR